MAKNPTSKKKSGKKEKSAMRQLSPWDAVFITLDTPQSPMSGGFLHVYAPYRNEDSAKRFQRLVKLIEQKLDSSQVLRRKIIHSPLDLDLPWFVDDCDVNLTQHIFHHTLPAPGDNEQLNRLYADIASRQMVLDRPLWEIHFIDGLNAVDGVPKNAFALFIKFHHSGVDGGSAAEITSLLHRTNPTRERLGRGLKEVKTNNIYKTPTLMSSLSNMVERYAGLSSALGKEVLHRLPGEGRKVIGGLIKKRAGHHTPPSDNLSVPRTIFNVEITADRTYTHLSFKLTDIGRMRKKVPGATVNDVYLAVVGGAVRDYLKQHNALPRRSLVTGLTIDVRDEQDRGKGGNKFVFVRIPLGTDQPDHFQRLKDIVETTAQAKAGFKNKLPKKEKALRTDWQALVPEPLLLLVGGINRAGFFPKIKPLVNLGATNVPGPKEVLYLDGSKLVDFSGTPPIFQGIALVINATSYDKALRVSVFACSKIVPDPENLNDCLQKAFDQLKEDCGISI